MIMQDKANLDVSDPLCTPDTFIEGVASITKAGSSCLRIELYALRDGEKVNVARLVCPADVAAIIGEQLRAFSENGAFIAASAAEGLTAN